MVGAITPMRPTITTVGAGGARDDSASCQGRAWHAVFCVKIVFGVPLMPANSWRFLAIKNWYLLFAGTA